MLLRGSAFEYEGFWGEGTVPLRVRNRIAGFSRGSGSALLSPGWRAFSPRSHVVVGGSELDLAR